MTAAVTPRVRGRVIMKVSITASGYTLPRARLAARTRITRASSSQAIPAYLATCLELRKVLLPPSILF